MPFFIYGSDAKTGVVAKRVYSEAATDAEARAHGVMMGLIVTSVVPCRADQNPAVIVAKALTPPVARRTAPNSAWAVKENTEALRTYTHSLESRTPAVYVTYLLIAVNVLIFIAMIVSGVSATSPKTHDLLAWGADFGIYTVNGQWWRLVSAMFVHIGFIHLSSNLVAFAYAGRTVERMFGNVGFLAIYIVSGLGGGILAMYLDPLMVHAGASGAIFGIYGALLAMLLRERNSIPAQILSKLKRFVGVFIAYNLIFSFSPGISMAAHVGGLITGFVCGLIAAQPLDVDNERTSRNMLVMAMGAVLCFACVFGMNAKYPNLDHMNAYIDRFAAIDKNTRETFNAADQRNRQGQLTNALFADDIDRNMLPAWRETTTQLDSLPKVDSRIVDNTIRYVHLRQEALEAMSASLRSDGDSEHDAAREKQVAADKLSSWAAGKKDAAAN